MILSINQPMFIPWLGYYHRIALSNFHVYLNTVQFEKGSLINRNIIPQNHNKINITVPINRKGLETKISDIEINYSKDWKKKHLKTFFQIYNKFKYFDEIYFNIEKIYNHPHRNLSEFIYQLDEFIFNYLNIKTKIFFLSDLNINTKKNELIYDICNKFKAKKYISGKFGKVYLDKSKFDKNNIEIFFYDYQKILENTNLDINKYSIVDFLFKYGNDSSNILNSINSYL